MNTKPEVELQSDLVKLGAEILERQLSSGRTPLFNTLKKALEAKPVLTRLIAFTDGSPTDNLQAETDDKSSIESPWVRNISKWLDSADVIIKIARSIGEATGKGDAGNPCIPIDTVFFGSKHETREIELLKYLSDHTGGYFLHFDPSKPNIWKQLKYLAPVNRLMLASASFRAEVEKGGKL